jgi:hypothetical protein
MTKKKWRSVLFSLFICILFFLGACSQSAGVGESKLTRTTTSSPQSTSTPSLTNSPTQTPTNTPTPTMTLTPTITTTLTNTPSPTYDFPYIEVNVAAAHCRYGPSKSFLHAADLYEGDHGEVRGRFIYSDWLYVKFDKLNYHCWVSPYVVDVVGDISNMNYVDYDLQSIGSFDLYDPAQIKEVYRRGDEVTIEWTRVPMTEDDDRGYLIVAFVCKDGAYLWWTKSFEDQYTTSYTVEDDGTCSFPSSGLLYTVEKHGFSEPVNIPWPQAQP